MELLVASLTCSLSTEREQVFNSLENAQKSTNQNKNMLQKWPTQIPKFYLLPAEYICNNFQLVKLAKL